MSGSDIVEADLVIVGVGVSPRSQLAARAGLDAPDGITVDEHLRTADPAIFAAGDVANAYHPLLGASVRVEHWANARWQGETAARSMLGHDAVHDRLPYFSSDQYDWGMEYTGHLGPEGYDQVVVRGHDREFVAFWLREGRVLAGMNVNVWDAAEPIGALIRSRAVVTPGRWPIPRCRSRSSLPPADPAQRSLWTPASSWRAITIRCTWLVPS